MHAAKALVHEEPLEGCWFNRSREWAARNRGLEVGYYDFATKYRMGLAPLPAFRELPPDEYRRRVAELIAEIEDEGRRNREDDPVVGVEAILSQNPRERPTRRPKRSARPMFHAHSREAKEALWGELKAFIGEYRSAADALRTGTMEGRRLVPRGLLPSAVAIPGHAATAASTVAADEADRDIEAGRGGARCRSGHCAGREGRSGSPDHPT